ncbi:MAG TPA: hypothetical protein VKV39_04060 [Candidatus Sulfotelmatobacter sp.]|nr:hypothetical protein [Candidatus Sulfotelmatobacter sp.]
MKDDEELERYLSEFRPRAVRPLVVPASRARAWVKPMAAAAVLLVCAGGAVWYSRMPRADRITPPPLVVDSDAKSDTDMLSWFALTRLALEDDRKFEMELEQESRAELPAFTGPDSGLHILARE